MTPIKRWIAVLLVCSLIGVPVGAVGGSSAWAGEELARAEEIGLTFPGMKNTDAREEISRQEFCYIAAVLYGMVSGRQLKLTYASPFSDCSDPYVSFAAHMGIVNGTGGGLFSPDSFIRKQDLAVMLTRLLKACGIETESFSVTLFDDHQEISGYAQIPVYFLKSCGILKGDLNRCCQPLKSIPAEEAVILALRVKEKFFPGITGASQGILMGGLSFYMGMPAGELTDIAGAPAEVLASGRGFDWYVYPLEDSREFFMAGLAGGKLVAFYALGDGFSIGGVRAGDTGAPEVGEQLKDYRPVFYTDPFDSDRLYAFELSDPSFAGQSYGAFPAADFSRAIFWCTNAFRAYNNIRPLDWSDSAAKAAVHKSEDMARNNYFDHQDLNGYGADHLLTGYGVRWSSCGENLAAGQADGIAAFAAWVGSKGHRDSMLNASFVYVGVGAGFEQGSFYRTYYAQEFFSPKNG